MQRKIFCADFGVLGLIADVTLPLWWRWQPRFQSVPASWWIAYRSEWF